eukprot:120473-Amphidinium_carterae.1
MVTHESQAARASTHARNPPSPKEQQIRGPRTRPKNRTPKTGERNCSTNRFLGGKVSRQGRGSREVTSPQSRAQVSSKSTVSLTPAVTKPRRLDAPGKLRGTTYLEVLLQWQL